MLQITLRNEGYGYLYIDEMIIVGSNNYIIKSTNDMLNLRFEMKYMVLAEVILVIKINRTSSRIVLSQSSYTDKIIDTSNPSIDKRLLTNIFQEIKVKVSLR